MTAIGTSFLAEADMLTPLARAAGVLAGTESQVVYEVPGMAGIPDLVLIEPDYSAVAARRGAGPLTQPVEVAVLLALSSSQDRDGLMTATSLADLVGVGQRHLTSNVLCSLAERGHLERDKRSWRLAYEFRSVAKRIVTVEAKLRDWRRGYGQATRHAAGADCSWLAVDASAIGPALRSHSWFSTAGLGLAGVSANGDVEVFFEPKPSSFYPERRELLAERALDVLLSGRSSLGVARVFGRDRLATTGPDPRLQDAMAR